MSSGILIYDNKAFELFYGSDEMAQAYAEMINGFAEELPGIHVYNMVVPNHSAFGLPDRLLNEYGCTFQHQNIEEVCRNLSPSVTPVDIFDAVNLHNDEPIYLNTDTHWSGLGAYYAYREFVRIANAGEPADLETDFEARSYPNFTGYMAYATEESVLYENPDTLTIYDPKFSYTCEMSYDGIDFYTSDTINSTYEDAGYSMFLGGDQGCVRIYNHDISTGRKLLIVKDSYGNAISPFLACNFDETHVVDFRYFQRLLPAYCEENGITDVLFFNNVMSANTSMQLDAMRLLFE